MSSLNVNTITLNTLLYNGGIPSFNLKAWVDFNAITGTPVIRGSGNISSITDNGPGNFTINFSVAMPHVGYAVIGMCADNDSYGDAYMTVATDATLKKTTSVTVYTCGGSGKFDSTGNSLGVFY